MARRIPLWSWLAATLSVLVAVALGLLTVRPVPAGAAATREIFITVSDTGFDPPIVSDANVGDALIFVLNQTGKEHTVTFKDDSRCPGEQGPVPCWPELRFDTDTANCRTPFGIPQHWRCLQIREAGATVPYYDEFRPANVGEIRVLGQPTTTTGPSTTTTTTRPATTTTTGPTSTTQPPTTATTAPQTTTTTAPTPIRPLVVSDPAPTTSTTAPPASISNTGATPAPSADRDKNKGKDDRARSKAAGTETPTTVTPVAPDAFPPGTVFDPSSLTPSPEAMPGATGAPGPEDVNLESAAVMNLLDGVEDEGAPTDYWPMLLALGGLALVLSIGGFCIWFGRPSRYDPA